MISVKLKYVFGHRSEIIYMCFVQPVPSRFWKEFSWVIILIGCSWGVHLFWLDEKQQSCRNKISIDYKDVFDIPILLLLYPSDIHDIDPTVTDNKKRCFIYFCVFNIVLEILNQVLRHKNYYGSLRPLLDYEKKLIWILITPLVSSNSSYK